MLDLQSLGDQIAHYRKAAGLTQAALALRARVGRSTLDALENGRMSELGFSKIVRILAALGMDLKIVEARKARPTLEELLSDDED